MKLVVIPGFLGYVSEVSHHDLIERAKLIGIEGMVVESEELSKLDFENYRLSKHINTVNQALDQLGDEEVALVGISLGGVAATVVSHGRKNVTRLAAIVSPYKFASGDDMQPQLKQWEARGSYPFNSSRYGHIEIPYEFVTDAQQFDARDIMPEVECSKLFLAGSLDTRVPAYLTLELANAATDPKIYRVIKGMSHDYKSSPIFTKLVNDYVLEFVAG